MTRVIEATTRGWGTDARSARIAVLVGSLLVVLGAFGVLSTGVAAADPAPVAADHDVSAEPDNSTNVGTLCDFAHPEWRDRMTVAGVELDASRKCRPDNPYRVAAAVAGTNNVPRPVLMKSGYDRTTVRKTTDRDGDGDPDVIHITLEIAGVNGYNRSGPHHSLAPGVRPNMWVFAPRTTGMVNDGSTAGAAIRAPSPPIRAEAGDTVRVTVQNTHYFPHTIHFHGVDHPFERNGAGNDGVPQTSEMPIMPGESRTYEFTPEQPGSMFYHCHVVPNVHVEMGLSGLFVIAENRSNNTVQTLNVGAGKVRHPSAAVEAEYDGAYDLHYQALDANLTEYAQRDNDPQTLARTMNREHDTTDERADYFLLNGRSFPYTLQHSPVIVERDSRYRLRVLNSGPGTVSLHTHGHKVVTEALDGVELPERNEQRRDVVQVSPAQRLDLTLNTTVDGTNSYGPGVWFTHDHRERAVTTDGISPGGGITVIAYESYFNTSAAMPEVNVDLTRFFNASYYDGDIPYWAGMDDRLTTVDTYDEVTPTGVAHGAHDTHMHGDEMMMGMDMRPTDGGMVVNGVTDAAALTGCDEVRGTRSVTVGAGEDYAIEGEMYAYNRSDYDFEPCTRVEVTLVNHDDVRHQWMIHGLPHDTYAMGMFNVEADAGETVTGTFVTPPDEADLHLHCSLPQHEQKGMHGHVSVGGHHADDDHDESEHDDEGMAGETGEESNRGDHHGDEGSDEEHAGNDTDAPAGTSADLAAAGAPLLGGVVLLGIVAALRRRGGF